MLKGGSNNLAQGQCKMNVLQPTKWENTLKLILFMCYYTVWLWAMLLMFQRCMLLPSSWPKFVLMSFCVYILHTHFDPEDGGNMYL
jgi:hypothetical protein